MGNKRVVAAVLLGALQLVVLVSLALAGPDDEPHAAPVRIVAPPVVATTIVDRANDAAGRPLDARALTSDAEARASVERGHSVAAVVVDLRVESDIVYVAGANGADLNRRVLHQVRTVEQSFGRTVVVRDLVPVRDGDAGARGVYVLVGVSVLLGFVGPIVITWLRGPVAPTVRRGALRLAITASASMAVGLVVAGAAAAYYDNGFAQWWIVSALTVMAISTTTLALESLLGVVGIGVSTTVFVLAAAPLVRLTHPLLLPQPWSAITPWLPHGAAIEAGRGTAYFGGAATRPMLTLGAWSLLAIMTLVVARRERSRTSEVPSG